MQKVTVSIALAAVLLFTALCAWLTFIQSASTIQGEWSPAWSPDTGRVAFECMYGYTARDICVLNRNDNALIRLTRDGRMSSPAWSTKGQSLAWLKDNNTVVVWDVSSGQFRHFRSTTNFNYTDGYLQWSPNDQKIFVQGDGSILDIATGAFIYGAQLAHNPKNCCFTWSSDNEHLAYKRVKHQDSSGNHWQVVIMRGAEEILVSENETVPDSATLRWSPDGTTLAWRAEIRSQTTRTIYQLALTPVPTLDSVFITINNGVIGMGGFAWSPNGDRIAVRLYDQLAILSFRPRAAFSAYSVEKQQDIALYGPSFSGLSWSPDGKMLAYETSWQDNSRIWLTAQDGSTQIALYTR